MHLSPAVSPIPLHRHPDASPIRSGVCAGFAAHLGLAPMWIRGLFVLMSLTGLGLVVYPVAFLVMPGPDLGPAPLRRLRVRDRTDVVAYALIALGTINLARWFSAALPWWVMVPIGGLVTGFIVLLAVGHRRGVSALPTTTTELIAVLRTRPGTIARSTTGGVLVVGGSIVLLVGSDGWIALRNGVLALGIVIGGVGLVLAPWLWRLASELVVERRERVRSEERAEMAAHLHDSVLQTLAMVQRRADDGAEVIRLARRQERELREWLLSGRAGSSQRHETVGAALAALAAELEDLHGVPVEVVQVRDRPVTAAVSPLLGAAREAIVNAQRHSGAAEVSVYCEVSAGVIELYVRDRGRGFDPATIADDRQGVRESIEQRMIRHGGYAAVRSTPGSGTEVELRVNVEARTE